MKRSLAGMLVLLGGAVAVHAQGTVSLANYLNLNTYIYVSYKPTAGPAVLLGGSSTGPAPTLANYAAETGNGNDWTVALYGAPGAGASQGSMVLLAQTIGGSNYATATFAGGGSTGDPKAGTWLTGVYGTIVGTAAPGNGAPVSVQLAAWYNDGGTITSLAQAQADLVPWGESAIVNDTAGGPNATGPAATAANLPAIPNFDVSTVPEPSTIALGVMGASAFLMRLRRKS
jgi:hypothetical protein